MKIGYFLSCEEYSPADLLHQAVLAEQAGFEALWISDHFHPWNDEQGQSAFVWSMIGALSQVCQLPVTTAVTCPMIRTHPAIVAQAAATSAVLLDGRFTLGVGTGEALNEHIAGARFPTIEQRLEMLEESIEVIRRLWTEDFVTHHGEHYTVENARIYTKPETPPKIFMSGFGDKSAEVAARVGDGYITTKPDQDTLDVFRKNGGAGKPTQAGYKVCWGTDDDAAVATAHRLWANSGIPGEVAQVLPSPKHFEQASELVTEQMTRGSIAYGNDIERHLAAFAPYADAGFDEIYISQMGGRERQTSFEGFFEFYSQTVLPRLRGSADSSTDTVFAASDLSGRISELYADTQRCAAAAGLVYITGAEPGIRRRRQGRGFGYRDADNRPLSQPELKARIIALAIPPAWRNVWICPDEAGHIMAFGEDDRGRKQYVYHERWRELRDLLNFYRLVTFGEELPTIRKYVAAQLRRRTLDRDQVLAAMIRIIDTTAIRIGNEVYAEENDSFGLSTLTRRHVHVNGKTTTFSFPAKSGKRAELAVDDSQIARVVTKLEQHRTRRLFTLDGRTIESGAVNDLLNQLTGQHITAKDFRTWRGTLAAFSYLEQVASTDDPEPAMLAAADAAADVLGNTRAVARAHYIHPHVLSSFADGTFADHLRAVPRRQLLDGPERKLLGFLKVALESDLDAVALGVA